VNATTPEDRDFSRKENGEENSKKALEEIDFRQGPH
jgi:hypothetical protein